MHLFGAGLPEKIHETRAGRAAYDGVVHHNEAFSLDDAGDRVELDAHQVFAERLARSDEGAADIAIPRCSLSPHLCRIPARR